MNFKIFLLFLLIIPIFLILKIFFQPLSLVLPHHNLVKDKRLEFLKTIAKKRPLTRHIILIGPDHFSPNQANLFYADADWHLSTGQYSFDRSLNITGLTLNNHLLKSDHAIYNLLPDLKTVFPNSQVFPILIGQKYPLSKLESLLSQIKTACNFNCLLIASVDFSHYLPAAVANVHDQKSLFALQTQKIANLDDLEVDSPQSLYLLTQFSKFKNAKLFNLFSHTNSGFLAQNPVIETTTHFMGSYQRSIFTPKLSPITTFTFTQNIDPKLQSASLGDRFFYGVDQINSNLSLPHNLSPNITVVPTSSTSILRTSNHLIINLSSDFSLSGYLQNRKLHLVFSPLTRQGNQVFFDRSPSRPLVPGTSNYGSVVIKL